MINKPEFINYIIKYKNYKSYLELGVGPHIETISKINCNIVHSVDILKVNEKFPSFVGTVDEFFAQNTNTYDAIYIDADLEYSAVKRNFENSVKVLNEGGVIFMHDVGPATESGTSLTAHGTVYKFFIELRQNLNYDAFSFEFLPGSAAPGDVLGIVKIKDNSDIFIPNEKNNLSYSFYDENKNGILRRLTVDNLLKLV